MAPREKLCTRCKAVKRLSEFTYRKRGGKPHSWCVPCCHEYSVAYRQKNRDVINEKRKSAPSRRAEVLRNNHLKAKYGMTLEEYTMWSEAQRGRCEICKAEEGNRLVVDHCHNTGSVRGLICRRCNSALGYARDSIQILLEAAAYLSVREQARKAREEKARESQ